MARALGIFFCALVLFALRPVFAAESNFKPPSLSSDVQAKSARTLELLIALRLETQLQHARALWHFAKLPRTEWVQHHLFFNRLAIRARLPQLPSVDRSRLLASRYYQWRFMPYKALRLLEKPFGLEFQFEAALEKALSLMYLGRLDEAQSLLQSQKPASLEQAMNQRLLLVWGNLLQGRPKQAKKLMDQMESQTLDLGKLDPILAFLWLGQKIEPDAFEQRLFLDHDFAELEESWFFLKLKQGFRQEETKIEKEGLEAKGLAMLDALARQALIDQNLPRLKALALVMIDQWPQLEDGKLYLSYHDQLKNKAQAQ